MGVGCERQRITAAGYWLVVGVLATVAVFKTLGDTLDPDCFWHLRVAEQLHRDGVGPLVDEISFASSRQPWTPYSWLAELGMHAVWSLGGYQAAVLASALLAATLVALVAMSCEELAGPERRFNSILAVALAACLSLPYLSFRPATLAIVLLALCAWLMLRDRRLKERSWAVWLIVPATALLVNVHLTAIFVPLWVGCFLAGALMEGPAAGRRTRRYALLMAGCCVACLMTPMLPGVLRAGWHYQSHDVMVASGGIEEMRPLYSTARGLALISIVAAITLLALLYGRRRLRVGEWMCLGISVILLLRLGRFAPVFAIIAAPVLAATAPAIPDLVLSRPLVRWGAAALIVLGIALSALLVPGPGTPLDGWLNRNGADRFGYPCAAAEFVERNVPVSSGRLINEFDWGGYLSWRLGDRFRVYVDGRTQLYSAEFWHSTFLCDDTTRAATLSRVSADAAIVPLRDSVFRDSLVRLGWRRAYRDDRADVFLPPMSAYAGQH